MDKKTKSNIFITGGHLTPLIEVYSKIKDIEDINIYFIGVKHTILFDKAISQEYKFAKENNIKFLAIKTGKLYRFLSIKGILSFFLIAVGFIQSTYYILKYHPKIIVSFGSYVSLPVSIVGSIKGSTNLTHIQAIIPGLSDRINSKFAKYTFISWRETEKYLKTNGEIIYTGNIVRKEIFNNKGNTFNLNNTLPILYVTGGNQGSHAINELIFQNLKTLLKKYNIVHQTGSNTIYNDFEKAINYQKKFANEKGIYIPKTGIWNNEIGEILNKSDLVIGRSGANSVYEILLLSKKAILIPLPNSAYNEQMENAKIAKNLSKNIVILEEKEITNDIFLQKIDNIIEQKQIKNSLNLPENAELTIIKYILKSY